MENTQETEVEQRVAAEIASLKKNAQGEYLINHEKLAELSIETRLVLLLDAGAGHARVADSQVFNEIKDTRYKDIHPSKGGLAWDAYQKYARECPTLLAAAERHRAFVTAKKK